MGMAADGSIHAIWLDARDMEDPQDGAMVYATASRDDGKTFSEDYLISTGDACPCCQITTAFSKDTMLMGYRKIYDDGRDSTVAMSTDGGRSFNQSARLPFQPWDIDGCPLKPTALGIDGDRVFAAAYTGGEEPPGVYFSQSNDGGRNFSGKIPAHPDAAYSDAPELTVSTDGNIRLVWQAKTTGPRRLFFSESADHGETFTQPTEISTPSGSSAYPATDVATDGTVFIAWQQEGEEVFVTTIPASGDIAAR